MEMPRPGDWIRWKKRQAVVRVAEVDGELGLVTTEGKRGVSWMTAPVRNVRAIVVRARKR